MTDKEQAQLWAASAFNLLMRMGVIKTGLPPLDFLALLQATDEKGINYTETMKRSNELLEKHDVKIQDNETICARLQEVILGDSE